MIDNIVKWIIQNCEWIFSGIGITIIVGIINFFYKKYNKGSEEEKSIKIEQKNESPNSTQIGIQNNYYGGKKDA